MTLENIAVAAFSALTTFVITELRHARSERKNRINDVAERYISATKTDGFRDTKAARMYAMQCAGVASFKGHYEVGEFFKIVTQRGCTIPLASGDWHPIITQKTLPGILHEASVKGHQLISDKAMAEYLIHCLVEAEKIRSAAETHEASGPRAI